MAQQVIPVAPRQNVVSPSMVIPDGTTTISISLQSPDWLTDPTLTLEAHAQVSTDGEQTWQDSGPSMTSRGGPNAPNLLPSLVAAFHGPGSVRIVVNCNKSFRYGATVTVT